MSQITIYLEDSLEEKIRLHAKQEGLSVSKWIAQKLVVNNRETWPSNVLAAFGTWADVPEVEALRANDPPDSPREAWD